MIQISAVQLGPVKMGGLIHAVSRKQSSANQVELAARLLLYQAKLSVALQNVPSAGLFQVPIRSDCQR